MNASCSDFTLNTGGSQFTSPKSLQLLISTCDQNWILTLTAPAGSTTVLFFCLLCILLVLFKGSDFLKNNCVKSCYVRLTSI